MRIWLRILHQGRAVIWNVGVSPKTAPHRHLVMLEDAGLKFLHQFVWQKVGVPVPTLHSTRMNPQIRRLTSNFTHEMIYVLANSELALGPPCPLPNETLENDVFALSQSMASIDLPAGDQRTGAQSNLDRRSFKAHPAPFPVALVTAFLQHYVASEECVLEPFAGSGSTLIGCDQLGARCHAMEVSAQYVQIAIDRWETLTGERAQKVNEANDGR